MTIIKIRTIPMAFRSANPVVSAGAAIDRFRAGGGTVAR
jgi:hypothetical protein